MYVIEIVQANIAIGSLVIKYTHLKNKSDLIKSTGKQYINL